MKAAAPRRNADYDWRGFSELLCERLRPVKDLTALAAQIGVTVTDLCRASAGQIISVPKLIAICDWMQIAVRAFYLRPGIRPALPEKQERGRPGVDRKRMSP